MLFLICDVSFELAVSETQKVVTKRTEMSWEIKCLSSVYCFGNQVFTALVIKCLSSVYEMWCFPAPVIIVFSLLVRALAIVTHIAVP
jgi:hypothetical protein